MNLENNNHKKNNIILALALIKHLYNKGDIPVNLCQYSGHLKCDFYAAQGAIL